MDVKIYPNNFNAFITAEKVVDENNQQLSNYVCNVTYTNLKDGQITEIGQQFAKHLSDTDENGNSKAGLHKVALTGNYTQLENKPSASNLQGFHEVAFSGQASALDNGTGNNVTFLTKTAFDASVAGKIKQSDVDSWSNKATISDINNLKGNPTENNDTLEKLEQHKAQIVYINPMNSPYNYNQFGVSSFWDKNTTLITDIISQLNSNKIIILITTTSNWLVTNYTQNTDVIYISIINLRSDNYFTALTNVSNTIIKTEEETEEEYETRFNNAIINTLSDSFDVGMLIYDYNQQCSYFKFSDIYYINSQTFINIINDINSRLTALEEGE